MQNLKGVSNGYSIKKYMWRWNESYIKTDHRQDAFFNVFAVPQRLMTCNSCSELKKKPFYPTINFVFE